MSTVTRYIESNAMKLAFYLSGNGFEFHWDMGNSCSIRDHGSKIYCDKGFDLPSPSVALELNHNTCQVVDASGAAPPQIYQLQVASLADQGWSLCLFKVA
jgi:hypothetical protein